MDGIIERAKRFAGQVKGFVGQVQKDISGIGTAEVNSLKKVRERQGAGFYQADIGEGERSKEPAYGSYEHNSPAKPL